MFDSGDGHFVGAMPPKMFLKKFMPNKNDLAVVPEIDFSKVPKSRTIDAMRRLFVSIHTWSPRYVVLTVRALSKG